MTEKLLPSGFFFIDKPYGITSHDVVSKMRKILNTKKIGHAGTLDPMATGVLALGVGTSTRLLDYVQAGIKTYVAQVVFGTKTSTGDLEGDVIETKDMSSLTKEDLENACNKFIGSIEQIPPMTSAVKVDGKALYKYARQGVDVERKVRNVEIYSIEVLEFHNDGKSNPNADLKIVCSVGTYVRTLAEDIGQAAGGVAHLANLRRTNSGTISESDLISLEQLSESENPFEYMCDPAKAMSHYKTIEFDDAQVTEIYTGRKLILNKDQIADIKSSKDKIFVGIGHTPRKLIAIYNNPHNVILSEGLSESKDLLKSRCVIFLDL